ncbi:MAG: hypothetical protein PHX61_14685 [Alphaproteobacteria bacterium]|nr:hypothetical protein [Alphaproteobacteria bacterium]
MNEVILAVLAVLFVAESNLATKFVPFDRMPKECASAYRDYAHEVFGVAPAQGTKMAKVDFDCDGRNELLVYNGEHGSAGERWSIFNGHGENRVKIGEVFGNLVVVKFKTHKGLLACTPCGWEQAEWEYFEFKRGQFVKQLEITVNYAPPKENILRDRPQRIVINICNEK